MVPRLVCFVTLPASVVANMFLYHLALHTSIGSMFVARSAKKCWGASFGWPSFGSRRRTKLDRSSGWALLRRCCLSKRLGRRMRRSANVWWLRVFSGRRSKFTPSASNSKLPAGDGVRFMVHEGTVGAVAAAAMRATQSATSFPWIPL